MKTMTATQIKSLDKLVSHVTASPDWADLEAKMLRGYVPSIRPRYKKNRELIAALKALGYRVFDEIA